jgi:large subunit ribosomal protein L35
MPKMKTKKAVAKRFKVTASGKIMMKHTNRSHRAFGKTHKQKVHLRGDVQISPTSDRLIGKCLPYKNFGGKR